MPSAAGAFRRGLRDTGARRPALPMAIAFIGGIAGEPQLAGSPALWLGLGGMSALAAMALFRRPLASAACLVAALFFAGVTAARLEATRFPASHVALFTSDDPRLAELEVRILDAPRVFTAEQESRPLPPKQFARAEVKAIKTRRGWIASDGEVALTIGQPHPTLAAGQLTRVVGLLQRPAPAMNPGQFDAAAHYRRQRVLATITVPHVDGVTLLAAREPGPFDAPRERARRLLAAGFTGRQSIDHAVLLALTLGDRDPEADRVRDDFSRSGTAHLLAVSGLHVILVAGSAALAFRLLGRHPRTVAWAMVGAAILYASIAMPAAPVLRATVLCLAFAAAQLTGRRRDGIQVLSLCALGLLVHHPHDLYGAGFQLSFVTVFGMLLYAPRVNAWCDAALEDRDRKVAHSFRPPGAWAAMAIRFRVHLLGTTAIGVIAWLVSMPLVAYHFDQMNPWAVLAGLLLLPVVALGLIGGLAKIGLTLLLPGFSPLWAILAAAPMGWMRHEVSWLARLPAATLPMAQPPLWGVMVFYALLALPLLPWTIPSIKRWMRCAPAAAAILAFLPMLPALLGATTASSPEGDTRVTLLAVGAGQIGVIELPDGRALLIDDGSSSLTDPFRKCLEPYLRSRGCRSIETIFLSHPDFDHISATAETADGYHPSRVMASPVFRAQSRGNPPAEAMLARLDESHVPVEAITRGRSVALDPDCRIDVLWPPADHAPMSTNNAGVVLRLTCHGRSVLFPADIQVGTERELMDLPGGLRADVMVAPHHGSAEATTAEFIRAVGSGILLSSNDRRLSKKQREFDRLAGATPLFRTSVYGAITLHVSKDGTLRVETFLKPKTPRAVP